MTSAAASPDDPLGYDAFVREDIDEDGRDATGLELTQNAILHRITTDKLLLTDAPSGEDVVEFGEDVRKWVGSVETQDSANAKAPRLVEVIKREPNINPNSIRVDIQMQLAGARWAFIIAISCRTTTELPVALTLGVDAMTVELLSQGK
jgi:hypothetical protein